MFLIKDGLKQKVEYLNERLSSLRNERERVQDLYLNNGVQSSRDFDNMLRGIDKEIAATEYKIELFEKRLDKAERKQRSGGQMEEHDL